MHRVVCFDRILYITQVLSHKFGKKLKAGAPSGAAAVTEKKIYVAKNVLWVYVLEKNLKQNQIMDQA